MEYGSESSLQMRASNRLNLQSHRKRFSVLRGRLSLSRQSRGLPRQ
jgi:hypothetical protein